MPDAAATDAAGLWQQTRWPIRHIVTHDRGACILRWFARRVHVVISSWQMHMSDHHMNGHLSGPRQKVDGGFADADQSTMVRTRGGVMDFSLTSTMARRAATSRRS